MIVRKVIAGSALAAGLGVAGMFGAMGTASADPGLAVSGNGVGVKLRRCVGEDDHPGNFAVAFNGGKADASGSGTGNLAIAGAGSAARGPGQPGKPGRPRQLVPSSNNLVVGLGGGNADVQGSDNRVLANGADSTITGNGTNNAVASLCGGKSSISAQSDRVALTPLRVRLEGVVPGRRGFSSEAPRSAPYEHLLLRRPHG